MFWRVAHLMLYEATEILITCFTTYTANEGGIFSWKLFHVVGIWAADLVVLALSKNLLQWLLEMQIEGKPCNVMESDIVFEAERSTRPEASGQSGPDGETSGFQSCLLSSVLLTVRKGNLHKERLRAWKQLFQSNVRLLKSLRSSRGNAIQEISWLSWSKPCSYSVAWPCSVVVKWGEWMIIIW